MNTHNVKFPSGLVVDNVPVDMTKEELVNKLVNNGYSYEQLGLLAPDSETPSTPVEDKSSIVYAMEHPKEAFSALGNALGAGASHWLLTDHKTGETATPTGAAADWYNEQMSNPESKANALAAEKALKTGASMAVYGAADAATGGLLTPFLPELEAGTWGARGVGLGKMMLTNTAGSVASQELDNGHVSLKQTGEDLLFAGIGEGTGKYLIKPATEQYKSLYDKLSFAQMMGDYAPTSDVAEYLDASRALDLAKEYKTMKKANPNATILDAYQSLYEQSPDLYNAERVEGIKKFTRPFKVNADPQEMIDILSAKKQALADYISRVEGASSRISKPLRTAENNRAFKGNMLTGKLKLDNDVVDATPLQKLGAAMDEYAGYGDTLSSLAQREVAEKAVRADAEKLIKALNKDNERIEKQRNALAGKKGQHIKSQRYALNYQTKANNKMIEYLENGLQGKKVNINDFNLAIKKAHEAEFGNENLTKQFRDLSERFDQMNLIKLASDEDVSSELLRKVGKWGLKKAAIGVGLGSGLGTVPTALIATASTIAGRLSQRSKSKALERAYALVESVKNGELDSDEAHALIDELLKQKDAQTKALISLAGIHSSNDKK